MTEIELTESTLIIHLEGLAKTLASLYKVPLEIPLTHVVEIAVDPHVMEKWDQMEEKFEGPLPGEKPQLGVVSVEVFKKKMFWGHGYIGKEDIYKGYSWLRMIRTKPLQSNSLTSSIQC